MSEVKLTSAAEGNGQKSMPPRRRGSVQQGRELLARSRWGSPLFDARSVLSVREHGKRATCLRVAASAKAGNAAGGFFQHSHDDTEQRIIGNIGCLGLEEWKSISQIFPL